VVKAMREDGIDISGNGTTSVMDLYREGHTYSYVITVCSREAEEKCPIFPGPVNRIQWPFPDPSQFTGTEEEIMEKVREIRDAIKTKITEFIEREVKE
jgi:arsenate reductase